MFLSNTVAVSCLELPRNFNFRVAEVVGTNEATHKTNYELGFDLQATPSSFCVNRPAAGAK
jgi:hypothetical protein